MKHLTQLQKFKEQYPHIIVAVDYEDNSYWIYLHDGWLSTEDTHTIHEDTVTACISAFDSVRGVPLDNDIN